MNERGLVVDLFAGGGGASVGMAMALGKSPDIAINHDADAIAMHTRNHPETQHYQCDVFEVHPLMATKGKPVDILWASPSCTHFSRARAGVPKEEQMRTQPYVVTWWARYARPKIIFVENVPEIQTWGPLNDAGFPDETKKGRSFDLWIHSLRRYGYKVDWRVLTACDYGAPTSRTRFFLIARCDGFPIVWPDATHAESNHGDVINGELKPYRVTAEIIDWDDLGHSIFLTPEEVKARGLRCKRPLAGSTLRRVAKGMEKYVFNNPDPFIIEIQYVCMPDGSIEKRSTIRLKDTGNYDTSAESDETVAGPFLTHIQHSSNQDGTVNIEKPMPNVTARPKGGGMALVSPFLAKHYTGIVGQSVTEPIGTITAIDHHSVVAPTLIQMGYGETPGKEQRVLDLNKPLGTVVAGGNKFALATAYIQRDFGQSVGADVREPLPTVTAGGGGHSALASAFVFKSNHVAAGYECFRGHGVDEPLHAITSRLGTGIAVPFISKMRGDNIGYPVTEPMQTVSAKGQHHAAVSCMIEYYGTGSAFDLRQPMKTQTTKDRFGLISAEIRFWGKSDTVFAVTVTAVCFKAGPVWVDGEAYLILDITLRMLFPRELFRGQGFPEWYEIEEGADGRRLSTKVQVEKAGNSVPPAMSETLANANYVEIYGNMQDLETVQG